MAISPEQITGYPTVPVKKDDLSSRSPFRKHVLVSLSPHNTSTMKTDIRPIIQTDLNKNESPLEETPFFNDVRTKIILDSAPLPYEPHPSPEQIPQITTILNNFPEIALEVLNRGIRTHKKKIILREFRAQFYQWIGKYKKSEKDYLKLRKLTKKHGEEIPIETVVTAKTRAL